ncbi:uncharacterized protein LOC131148737 isoform X2 [Malania oleifera]|uniref:uncharacterized protein LOC131148737 isoform X2 n=1 Tax=Malania oleifera TaxID=397392 RepID=UPI0025ADF492|nr:uncharacterized protein LOC131148737 isoform X2 [Malania oleifera]
MESGLIAVDRWAAGCQAYFLTHLHADHTVGLSSSWARGLLFCSRITAKLFPFKFPKFRLSLLRILDVGSWNSLSLRSPSSASETTVQVMAIDAHHCPGAVMYLFRGEFGCMLYTGDFRWETTNGRAKTGRTMLLNALEGDAVDTLYLDNTFCNPSFSFPSREVAAQQVVDIIASHPEHEIIIGIDSLGKEELLLHISRTLKIKIWVWPERLQTLHLLGFQEVFTTNTSLTRVRAVPRYSFSIDTLEGLNTMRPTIGIMPSGLPWTVKSTERNGKLFCSLSVSSQERNKGCTNGGIQNDNNRPNGNLRSMERFHQYIYSVPYSDHSCYSEIKDFIKLVQPTNMKGIVSSSFCYADPFYYFGHLCGTKQPSQRFLQKLGKNGEVEGVEGVRSKFALANEDFGKLRRKREMIRKIDYLGVRASRVTVLRRVRHGAKISESES